MQIAFLSMHPGFGGAITSNISVCKMLSEHHDVVYIEEFTENLDYDQFGGRLRLLPTPLYKNRYKPWILFFILKKLKPNYIIIGVPFVLIYYFIPLLILRLCGVKIGLMFHSINLQHNLKGRFIDSLISLLSFFLTHLFFVSKYTENTWNKKFFINKSQSKHRIIYNAISPQAKINNNKKKVSVIGFVGRVDKEKCPDLFCQLAKHSQEKGYPYKFQMWGEGPLLDMLKDEYKDYVDFKGYTAKMIDIYKGMDLLMMTSIFENCPMVILEAKSYGIPTLAPSVGGIPEIITNYKDGILYDNLNLDYLISQVQTIDNDFEKYSNFALESFNLYSVDRIADSWFKVLDEK